MKTANDIVNKDIITVSKNETFEDVIRIMKEKSIKSIIKILYYIKNRGMYLSSIFRQ